VQRNFNVHHKDKSTDFSRIFFEVFENYSKSLKIGFHQGPSMAATQLLGETPVRRANAVSLE